LATWFLLRFMKAVFVSFQPLTLNWLLCFGSVHVNFQFLVMCLFLWTLLALQWLDKLWAMIMENPLDFIGEINLLTCWALTKFLSEWIEEFICSIILLSAHHTLVDFQRDDFVMLFQTGHHIQNHVLISCWFGHCTKNFYELSASPSHCKTSTALFRLKSVGENLHVGGRKFARGRNFDITFRSWWVGFYWILSVKDRLHSSSGAVKLKRLFPSNWVRGVHLSLYTLHHIATLSNSSNS